MLKKKIIAFCATLFLLSACASIVNHSANPVSITSFPENANYTVTDKEGKVIHSGKTPETVSLKTDAGYFRGEKYTLNFQKEGFGSQTTPLNAELNSWYWGNLFFGGFTGMLIVDPLTGAMWSLPESKTVYLVPNP